MFYFFIFKIFFFFFIHLFFSHSMHPDHKLPSLHSTQFPAPNQCHESGKANSEVLKLGELTLPSISSSTWESSFHTPPGTEELTLFAGSQVS